ncbi:MAG: LacI family DNA-binding transcriptional regulator [Traorella sp.]
MKRITIYDVAKEAGVSLATVSRVINASNVVREDTRVKVEEAINKLGYKPNAIAQGLALSKTTTIALIIPGSNLFMTNQMINGLLDVSKIYKYNIVLHSVSEGISQMEDVIDDIIKSRADGVIIFNDKLNRNELHTLNSYQIPIVVIGNKISDEMIGSVYIDYENLAYEAVSNYLDRGIDDIALVEDRKNPSYIRQLLRGINRAYDERGLKFNQYIDIPHEYRSSYLYLKDYFKSHKHQMVLTYRDSQAMAVLNTATENGIRIPEEMEIICVYDSKYNSMVRPQISSYKIPDYDLGAVAMRVMTKMLHDENEVIDKEIELSYIYTARKTTK